ncbi:MAG: hypothetical protein WA810_03735 [Maribacter sp.]
MGIVQVFAAIAISFAVGVIIVLLRDQLKGAYAAPISQMFKNAFRTSEFDNLVISSENVEGEKEIR